MTTKYALAILVLLLLLFPSQDPYTQHRDQPQAAPTAEHWFGTDDYGRDVWARFIHGGRWSIGVGVSATALCLLLAWTLGAVAASSAFAGPAIVWLADLFLCLPWLYLLIAARAMLPLQIESRTAFAMLLLLLACTGWARPAKLVRGKVLEVRERGYVRAAQRFGVSQPVVFVRHILPATLDLLLAQTLLLLPRFVLAELTLSFLGAGAAEPHPGWGSLVIPLKQAYALETQWWRVLPLLAMIPFFVLCAWTGRNAEARYRTSR